MRIGNIRTRNRKNGAGNNSHRRLPERVLCAVMAAVLTLTLAACGKGGSEQKEPGAGTGAVTGAGCCLTMRAFSGIST